MIITNLITADPEGTAKLELDNFALHIFKFSVDINSRRISKSDECTLLHL